MNEICIKYETQRNIKFVELEGELCAFRQEIKIEDNTVAINEGITTKKDLNDLILNNIIKESEYYLCKNEILEYHRQNNMFKDYKIIEEYIIYNPYSYIKTNKLDGTILLEISFHSDEIYDLEKNKCPKPVYFDYINGGIDNNLFDLEESLKILKQRNDIKWISEGVVFIPSYNCEPDRNRTMEFYWIPSHENWTKLQSLDNDKGLRRYIIDNILNLKLK